MIDQQTLKSVEDLHRLKSEGVITEDEFEKAKAKLLFGPAPPKPIFATGSGSVMPLGTPAADDFFGWVTLPLKRYADFSGRSSRREFWTFQLAVLLFAIFVIAMFGSSAEVGAFTAIMMLFAGVGTLGLIVPLLALQVRRFHDQEKSGWFVLLNLVPVHRFYNRLRLYAH
jgi:uncharacterized membrane protein YhaH (DUF805 family)